MERKPEDIQADPLLRSEYIEQISWDEWALENAPFFLVPDAPELVERIMREVDGLEDAIYEDALAVATQQWQSMLDPQTNLNEVLYLQGYTDYTQRHQIIEQQHAELLRRAIAVGLIDERQQDIEFREQFGD